MYALLGKQLSKPSGLLGKYVAKIMEKGNRKYYDIIIPELQIKNGEKIYEIGYGPGVGLNIIANQANRNIIGGIDYSELMFKKATEKNKKFIDNGIMKLDYGDLLTAETGNEKYDKIFCVNVVYFWNDLSEAFGKIYPMLNDNGMFFIFMAHEDYLRKLKFTGNFNKHSIEKVESELKKAGFNNIEYKFDIGYYIRAGK